MLRLTGKLIDSLSSYPVLFGCFIVNTDEALHWSDDVEKKLIYGWAEGSGMSTAAGLIGPCTAQSSREQPWMWGDTLLWQLVGRVAMVGCTLVRIKFRNKLTNWPWNWGRIQSKHITAGSLYVFFLFFASVCVCGCLLLLLLISPFICVWAEWYSREMSQEKGVGAGVRDMNPPAAVWRGNPLEVLGCVQSSLLQTTYVTLRLIKCLESCAEMRGEQVEGSQEKMEKKKKNPHRELKSGRTRGGKWWAGQMRVRVRACCSVHLFLNESRDGEEERGGREGRGATDAGGGQTDKIELTPQQMWIKVEMSVFLSLHNKSHRTWKCFSRMIFFVLKRQRTNSFF